MITAQEANKETVVFYTMPEVEEKIKTAAKYGKFRIMVPVNKEQVDELKMLGYEVTRSIAYKNEFIINWESINKIT